MKIKTLLLTFILAALSIAEIRLVSPPQLVSKGGNLFSATFELNEYADVAVSIVDPSDSTIVRHLAAGVLGPKAGMPFAANSLSQTIDWDGTDDLGEAVANASSMKVRVRAGMTVRLVNLEGDNPYNFRPANFRAGKISGMVSDDSGNVYIQGMPSPLFSTHTSLYAETIRKYDRNGNYIKTVFPFPGGMAPSAVRQWGVRYKEDSTYLPQHTVTTMPSLSATLLSPYGRFNSGNGYCQLIPLNGNGDLILGTLYNHIKFHTDGSITDSTSPRLLKSPALPAKTSTSGLMNATYFGTTRNLSYYYISGNFQALSSSGQLSSAVDTGLFRDGRIYKVDKVTGNATIWYAYPDSIPLSRTARIIALGGSSTDAVYATYHGTAVDAQGRVYVCDRLKKRLAVFDSSANFLGAVNIGYFPENVIVSPTTGVIYLATKQATATTGTGIVRLYKFGPWTGSTTAICSLEITRSFSSGIGISPNPVYLHLDERGATPRVWIGFSGSSVRIYEDQGTNLAIFKDFAAATKTMNNGYCSRLAVDRRTETVYINDGWEGLYRIDDWSNPLAKPLKTSDNKTILGAALAISPDYHLYVRRAGIYSEPVNGPLLRYTTGLTNNPLPFSNTGANQVTGAIYSFQGGMLGDGGLDISRLGDVAVYSKTASNGPRCLYIYPDTGSAATGPGRIDVVLPSQSFGVRYDRDGNLYVGAKVNNPNQTIPSGFAGDWAYSKTVGSVMKIKRGDTANFTGSVPTGVTKMYTQPISPFSQDRLMGNCICMGPSFELDPYGRLFIPNAITSSISVTDNEGNTIITFGEYGNSDNTGGLLREGSTIASPAIPFGMPTGVVASEDYIYVSDFLNNRLARIQMVYQLDNMPKATVGLDARAKAMSMPVQLSTWPNPANRNISITLDLLQSGRIRLDVYRADGRHVKNIHSGVLSAGRTVVGWNGVDAHGKQVAVGAYFLRLLAGHQVYYRKVVIGK